MGASILVKDVLRRVSSQLHDISPQFTRWTQVELVDWLNDAQRQIAKYIPSSCVRVDAIKLTAGSKQSIAKILTANIKPGDGSAAADSYGTFVLSVVRNMGSDGATPGRVVRIVDREIMDSLSPNWHAVSGSPITQYVFDPRYPTVFYTSPAVPTSGSHWVEVSYLANPTDVSQSGDYTKDSESTTKISVDDKYVDDLVNAILARAYMKDAEFANNANLAAAHTTLFANSLNAQVLALTGVNPNLTSGMLNPNMAKRPAQA